MWQELFDSLEIVVPPGYEPLPKPRIEDLDAYEARTGFRLPDSYRQFCLVFGPGALDGALDIRTPGFPDDDLSTLNDRRISAERSRRYDNPQRAARMILFGSAVTADVFGWDPGEVTDAGRNEYAIYMRRRDEPEIERLASTFRDVDFWLVKSQFLPHSYHLAAGRRI